MFRIATVCGAMHCPGWRRFAPRGNAPDGDEMIHDEMLQQEGLTYRIPRLTVLHYRDPRVEHFARRQVRPPEKYVQGFCVWRVFRVGARSTHPRTRRSA